MFFSGFFFKTYCVLCVLIGVLFLGGLVHFFSDQQPKDSCEMTYMFQYPQYVKISQDIDVHYPKYGLYAYGEGRVTHSARNMDFYGIPVLFIPGNAGSHQQVRSLSSVALRKALNSRTIFHFDYFTVKLNSEYSGLYGPVLNEQLEYVNKSLFRILELYKKQDNPPNQVILIGHSMGGVIAKKLLASLHPESKLIPVVLALATPFKSPLIKFDKYLDDFYKIDATHHQDTNIISIAGGHSDLLIPTYITQVTGSNALNLITSNIPKSWIEACHVQIVWCKQTVLAINRALFDIVDPKSKQIHLSRSFRDKVFHHHFIYNSGTKINLKSDDLEPYQLDHKGEWSESILNQYSISFPKGLREPHWYMVSLSTPYPQILTILAVNMEISNWIFACNAAFPRKQSRICVSVYHLSQFSEIAPSLFLKRRLITLNMADIKKNNTELTHIVFRALPTSETLLYHVDLYRPNERKMQVTLPVWFGNIVWVQETPAKAIIFDLELSNLYNMLQVYGVSLEPLQCNNKQHHAVLTLMVPWAHQKTHHFETHSISEPFFIRLQSARPPNASPPVLRLTLDPACTYRVKAWPDLIKMFGQLARYYYPFLITDVAVIFLQAFRYQLHVLEQTQKCPIFFTAFGKTLKPPYWNFLLVYSIAVLVPCVPFLKNILPQADTYELPHGQNHLMDFLVLHIIYVVANIIVFLLASIYSVSLFALESTVHKLALKLLARSVTFTMQFSDYFMSFLQKVPFVVAGVLIFLCLSTCGGLALCVGMTFYFLKLTQMSQDYVEEVVWLVVKSIARKIKKSLSKNSTVNKKQKNILNIKALESKVEKNDGKLKNSDEIENKNNTHETDKQNVTYDQNSEQQKDNEEHFKNNKENENIQENCDQSSGSDKENDKDIINDNQNSKQEEVENKNNHGDQSCEFNKVNKEINQVSTQENNEEGGILTNIETNFNPIFFHSSLFFIWCMITALNLPAVLTWAHNFPYSKALSPDTSFIPGLVLSLCAIPLWHMELPKTNRKAFSKLSTITMFLIVISLTYASISVYRLNFILTLIFALVILQQLFAPKTQEIEDISQDEDKQKKKQDKKYDDMMKKID